MRGSCVLDGSEQGLGAFSIKGHVCASRLALAGALLPLAVFFEG